MNPTKEGGNTPISKQLQSSFDNSLEVQALLKPIDEWLLNLSIKEELKPYAFQQGDVGTLLALAIDKAKAIELNLDEAMLVSSTHENEINQPPIQTLSNGKLRVKFEEISKNLIVLAKSLTQFDADSPEQHVLWTSISQLQDLEGHYEELVELERGSTDE